MTAHLELSDVVCGYGGTPVLDGLDLAFGHDSATALIGANGAGKTALLRTLAGLEPALAGSIRLDGRDVTGLDALGRARLGLRLVTSERNLFTNMTVREHLHLAAHLAHPRAGGLSRRRRERREAVAAVMASFPRLAERHRQRAATMSGGEQQMLALARALVAAPRLLLLDEPSAGLAPKVIDALYEALRAWSTSRPVTLIVAEQQPTRLLAMTQRAIVVQRGRVVADGPPAAVAADGQLWHHYGAPQVPGPRVSDDDAHGGTEGRCP